MNASDRIRPRLWAALLAPACALALAACDTPRPGPVIDLAPAARGLEATVFLSPNGPDQPGAVFELPAGPARETVLRLGSVAARPLSATLRCDGPGRLIAAGAMGPGDYLRPGASRRVAVPARGAEALPRLVLPDATTRCTLAWDGHTLALLRADRAAPDRAARDAAVQTCATLPEGAGDPLLRAFYAMRPLSQTCAAPVGGVTLLPGELEALQYRLEKLTGAKISAAALRAGDPGMALDFSRAPRFDEIVVSFLLIRADMAGWLVTRALAVHAARGTRVRILTAGNLMTDFDRAPFEALAAQYPGVQLQYFRWRPQGPGDLLNPIQRSNHVKLFLGLSPEAGRSFAIVGGRNLTDGFYFDGKADYPDFPFLHSYGKEAGSLQGVVFHSVYDDFEVALTDRARVEELAAHFAKVWARDAARATMTAQARPGAARALPADGQVRHFVSLPWADGHDHEAYYVSLIDAATTRIEAVTPFTYPTPAIEAALKRAAARGVAVRLVTRRGADEPPSTFTRALNAQFFKANRETFAIRSYPSDTPRLLHAKIILIDGRLGVVASSNLNRRSYLHDTENGLVFLDRAVTARLGAVFDDYWAISDTEPDPQAYSLILRLFAEVPGLLQYF